MVDHSVERDREHASAAGDEVAASDLVESTSLQGSTTSTDPSEVRGTSTTATGESTGGLATSQTREKGPVRSKLYDITLWISIASSIVAVIALVLTDKQTNAADEQNVLVQQQQLLSLASGIWDLKFSSPPPGDVGHVTAIGKFTLDAQLAELIVRDLRGRGVTGAEYYAIAEAIREGQGSPEDALRYYRMAETAPPRDIVTRGSAYRGEGGIRYLMGEPDLGHRSYLRAAYIAAHARTSRAAKDQAMAQSYVGDALQEAALKDCAVAGRDLHLALQLRSTVFAFRKGSLIGNLMRSAARLYETNCVGEPSKR